MLTMPDAEQLLCKLLDSIAEEHEYYNYEVDKKSTSSDGANYTTRLFLVTITAPGKDDLNLFVKVANMSEQVRAMSPIGGLYDTECFVYTQLVKIYRELEEKHGVPAGHRLIFPKFYGQNDKFLEETIVLENLMARGFTTYDRFKSIDWEYASASVFELAKLHALSIAYGEVYPEEYKKTLEKFEFKKRGDPNVMEGVIKRMTDVALSCVNETNRERLQRFLNNQGSNRFYENTDLKSLRRPVLAHGDYKQSNLMHKMQENCVQIMIVDYQTLRAASPVMDLYYFIFTGSDAEFRAKYYNKLIEYYYTQLCDALRRFGLDPEKLYSRKDYDYEREQLLPSALSNAVYTLQIITIDPENAPKMGVEMDITDFTVKTSNLYTDRLNGLVDDFVRWGVL